MADGNNLFFNRTRNLNNNLCVLANCFQTLHYMLFVKESQAAIVA